MEYENVSPHDKKVEVKRYFIRNDHDDTGVCPPRVYLNKLRKTGIDLSAAAQQYIEEQTDGVNYRLVTENLEFDRESNRWKMTSGKVESPVKISARFTYTTEDNIMGRHVGSAGTSNKGGLEGAESALEKRLRRLAMELQGEGIDYRYLLVIPSAYKNALTYPGQEMVPGHEFETCLNTMKSTFNEANSKKITENLSNDFNCVTLEAISKFLAISKIIKADGNTIKGTKRPQQIYTVMTRDTNKDPPLKCLTNFDKVLGKFRSMLAAFKHFMRDPKGQVDLESFTAGIEALDLNMPQEDVDEMFAFTDVRKRGKIDFNDFQMMKSGDASVMPTRTIASPAASRASAPGSQRPARLNSSYDSGPGYPKKPGSSISKSDAQALYFGTAGAARRSPGASKSNAHRRQGSLPSTVDPAFSYGKATYMNPDNLGDVLAHSFLHPAMNQRAASGQVNNGKIGKPSKAGGKNKKWYNNAYYKRKEKSNDDLASDMKNREWKIGRFKNVAAKVLVVKDGDRASRRGSDAVSNN